MATKEEVAWAAGLFEGEGTISVSSGTVTVRVRNTDDWVIERFADIVERGTVYGPYSHNGRNGFRRKPFWDWVAQAYDALDVLALLGTWLSPRRLDRAYELTGVRFHVTSLDASDADD